MNKTLFTLLFCLIICQVAFAQQEKIYYDSEWKVCNKSKADYYRLITFDENGKPKGKVKDFYITGELQWEGYFSSVDKYDNSKDINEGECIWYYKNGNKSRQSNMVNNLENGLTTYWFENGKIAREINYKMGIPDGKAIEYYESGKVARIIEMDNGKFAKKFFIECDEFGTCQNVFFENFSSDENHNNWSISNSKEFKSVITPNLGLKLNKKVEGRVKQVIHIPLNLEDDFTIQSVINFKKGQTNSGHGIIWGFKDWENYSFFYISADGYYAINSVIKGIAIKIADWTYSDKINKGDSDNLLKILRVSDKTYFSVNGNVLESSEFYPFNGNYIGFICAGEKEIIFKNLVVRQNISKPIEKNNNSNSEWKGNGTGFFIDKNGYIATNYHVVDGSNEIEVEFVKNGIKKSFPAKIIQSDKQNDISIIKINSPEFIPFINLPYKFKTEISDVGSKVFALGYPLLSLMGSEIKFTDGKISSKTGIQGDITSYQISVPIQPGNSGGPLFDFDGNLIGITSSGINRKLDITENVNYAIKSSYLKNLIDVLDYKLSLPNDISIANLTLTEKIKRISDYVVLIKIK